jgi:hypothetical protein
MHDGAGTEFLTNACLRDLYGWWRNEASSFKNFPNFGRGFDSVARPKTIEGTVTKDAAVYSESLPAGPGGQVLSKVESGTHVRVMRFDSTYGNVQVMAPNGITGLISIGDVILRPPNWTEWSKTRCD